MEQSFEDWKKGNPNGSINDYYKSVGRKSYQVASNDNYTSPQPLKSVEIQNSNYNLLVGVSISLIGFIGYFLPWFKVPIFNITISGNDLVQLANIFKNQITTSNSSFLKYTYVIPLTYGLIILGTIAKSYFVSAIGIITNLFVIGFLLGKLFFDIPDLVPYINIGIYMIGLSWLLMIYYFIILK